MRLSLLLPALFSIISCVHVSRTPAAQDPIPMCKLAFQNFLEPESNGDTEDQDTKYRTFISQANYVLDAQIPEFKKKLAAIEDMDACARETFLKELKLSVDRWNGAFEHSRERSRLLKLMHKQAESGPFFHDPQYGSKLTCVYACNSPEKCARKCKAKGFSELANTFSINTLAIACSKDFPDGDKRFVPEEFEENFSHYAPKLLLRLKEVLKLGEEVTAVSAKMESEMRPLAAKMKVLTGKKKKSACEPAPSAMAEKMEPYVLLIDNAGISGSGFLVKAKNEKRLVTVYHVFSYQLKLTLDPQVAELFYREDFKNRKTKGLEHTLDPIPGKFTRLSDIFQSPIQTAKPVLNVIEKNRLPVKDQKFFALGFPSGASNGYLRAVLCTFYGIASGGPGSGPRYVLTCKPGDDGMSGMSGGPLVDEEGTVWGVNTNVGTISGQLIVSPIYRSEDGDILHGVPQSLVTDLCLNSKNLAHHESCQLMDNQYETDIP